MAGRSRAGGRGQSRANRRGRWVRRRAHRRRPSGASPRPPPPASPPPPSRRPAPGGPGARRPPVRTRIALCHEVAKQSMHNRRRLRCPYGSPDRAKHVRDELRREASEPVQGCKAKRSPVWRRALTGTSTVAPSPGPMSFNARMIEISVHDHSGSRTPAELSYGGLTSPGKRPGPGPCPRGTMWPGRGAPSSPAFHPPDCTNNDRRWPAAGRRWGGGGGGGGAIVHGLR